MKLMTQKKIKVEIEKLAKICNSNLKNSTECMTYLSNRGISESIINEYMIGYFPQNISKLTKYVDFDLLVSANILKLDMSSPYAIYNYLIIPIKNEYGEYEGISGRTLMDDLDRSNLGIPKYRNSSYHKKNVLFGLDKSLPNIVSKNKAFVTEGYFDQISLCKNGIDNSVAACGTAFSKNHYLKLIKYCDSIYFIMDSDDAGIIASKRIYKKFKEGPAKLFFLRCNENCKDIDEFFSENTNKDFFKKYKIYNPCD